MVQDHLFQVPVVQGGVLTVADGEVDLASSQIKNLHAGIYPDLG